MRLAYYAGVSTAAAAGCLLKAFHERPNFYSATVYLSQSNACLLILTNLLLVVACGSMYGLQRVLYGPLRPIEVEQLSEKAWYAVLDTLLAMPSFREDVGGWLLTMFVLLLAGKVWGWIGEGRVDILEQQPPPNPFWFHVRLCSSLVLSMLFDAYMLKFCLDSVIAHPGPGMMVIFLFEFSILLIFSTFTFVRYQLSLMESGIVKKQTEQAIEIRKAEIRAEREAEYQREVEQAAAEEGAEPVARPNDEPIEVDESDVDVPGWEEKRRYLFAFELFTDFIKLLIYLIFFTISVAFNGLPMHIMRDVYMTFASFTKRITDYIAYTKATSDMNARYPDATTEEIRGDACIVCRESMVAWDETAGQTQAGGDAAAAADAAQRPAAPTPVRRRDEGLRAKKLPCGHILHLRCLKAWLERQQVCPTCRRPVVNSTSNTSNVNAPANQGVAGQDGARPPQFRHRPRFFNLGPIRVGFLNGPENEIRNALNQANQQAQQNNLDNQPGPAQANVAGQEPIALPTILNNVHLGGPDLRHQPVPAPVQIQLMQLEQRLMQEAHNLGIEQRQLAVLRAMEEELARLRAQHIPDRPFVGQSISLNPATLPGIGSFSAPRQLMGGPSSVELQGNPTNQLPNGHSDLPAGLVLPEGWTAMPLMPLAPVGAPQATSEQPSDVQSTSLEQPLASTDHIPGPHVAETSAGPVNGNGSPLFVPAQTSSDTTPEHTTSTPAPSQPVPESSRLNAAWTSGNDWSFDHDNQPSQADSSSSLTQRARNADAESETASGDKDKGKGRAVQLEEAPDAGD